MGSLWFQKLSGLLELQLNEAKQLLMAITTDTLTKCSSLLALDATGFRMSPTSVKKLKLAEQEFHFSSNYKEEFEHCKRKPNVLKIHVASRSGARFRLPPTKQFSLSRQIYNTLLTENKHILFSCHIPSHLDFNFLVWSLSSNYIHVPGSLVYSYKRGFQSMLTRKN